MSGEPFLSSLSLRRLDTASLTTRGSFACCQSLFHHHMHFIRARRRSITCAHYYYTAPMHHPSPRMQYSRQTPRRAASNNALTPPKHSPEEKGMEIPLPFPLGKTTHTRAQEDSSERTLAGGLFSCKLVIRSIVVSKQYGSGIFYRCDQ